MVKAQLAQIEKLDLTQAKDAIGKMEAQAAQVPEPFKPAFDYILKKLRERIQKLEAK